jgi:TPR repeat protein
MFKSLRLFSIGIIFVISGNAFALEQPSFDEIMQQAEQGNSLAQAKIGSIYYFGNDVDLGPKARFKEKARLKAAQYLLKDIEKDFKLAAFWFQKAADQGSVEAELVMAAFYDSGIGVSLNVRTADKWYKRAADHGSGTAQAITGKYKGKRLQASKDIPQSYALEILDKKL